MNLYDTHATDGCILRSTVYTSIILFSLRGSVIFLYPVIYKNSPYLGSQEYAHQNLFILAAHLLILLREFNTHHNHHHHYQK